MFSTAKMELKELVQLTHDLATKQATLNADSTIIPAEGYLETRARDTARKIELMKKYELA